MVQRDNATDPFANPLGCKVSNPGAQPFLNPLGLIVAGLHHKQEQAIVQLFVVRAALLMEGAPVHCDQAAHAVLATLLRGDTLHHTHRATDAELAGPAAVAAVVAGLVRDQAHALACATPEFCMRFASYRFSIGS